LECSFVSPPWGEKGGASGAVTPGGKTNTLIEKIKLFSAPMFQIIEPNNYKCHKQYFFLTIRNFHLERPL
jgi:hypothetical protein